MTSIFRILFIIFFQFGFNVFFENQYISIQFSYISMFFFFGSTIRRVFVTFPAYLWTWSNKDYKKNIYSYILKNRQSDLQKNVEKCITNDKIRLD